MFVSNGDIEIYDQICFTILCLMVYPIFLDTLIYSLSSHYWTSISLHAVTHTRSFDSVKSV